MRYNIKIAKIFISVIMGKRSMLDSPFAIALYYYPWSDAMFLSLAQEFLHYLFRSMKF